MLQKGLKWFADNYEEAKTDFGGINCKRPESEAFEEKPPN